MNYDNLVTCIVCQEQYDYIDEPAEIKQTSEHICAQCWEE